MESHKAKEQHPLSLPETKNYPKLARVHMLALWAYNLVNSFPFATECTYILLSLLPIAMALPKLINKAHRIGAFAEVQFMTGV